MNSFTICPTVTAFDVNEYKRQIGRLEQFTTRVHLDLMDGDFAPTKSPDINTIWWPVTMLADIHLMYQNPMDYIDKLIALKPHMVVIHNEAQVHHMHFAALLHKAHINAGLAILADTPIEDSYQFMHSFDHVLIFSGNLGYQGGSAVDLGLLSKVKKVRAHHPDVEIGWDGGISTDNVRELVSGGVQVLNVGGFIGKSDDPANAYDKLIKALQD
jgi:ribulose-phosphate 3-epimerase